MGGKEAIGVGKKSGWEGGHRRRQRVGGKEAIGVGKKSG